MSEKKWANSVSSVDRFNPSDRKRLGEELKRTYHGSMQAWEFRAIADVIAMTCEGSLIGHWGSIEWQHENGGFETGNVNFNWG